MPDGAQLDLFPAAQQVARDRLAAHIARPSPSFEWDDLLARIGSDLRVVFHLSLRWTRVVVEQINAPDRGRFILWHTGEITQYPASPHPACRTIYLGAESILAEHARTPLIPVWTEESGARFRMARDGEAPTETLLIPTLQERRT